MEITQKKVEKKFGPEWTMPYGAVLLVIVCVPIDKTNTTRVIHIEDYRQWFIDQLLKASDLALLRR